MGVAPDSRIHRFIIDGLKSGTCSDSTCLLLGEQARHVRSVLRLRSGAQLEVLDATSPGELRAFRCTLSASTPKFAEATIDNEIEITAALPIHILSGLPKGKTCEGVVEKCVEFGVQSVSFFIAERTQSKTEREKLPRLERIAQAALKQSGFQDPLPALRLYGSLNDALEGVLKDPSAGGGQLRLLMSTAPAISGQVADNSTISARNLLKQALVEDSPENAECYLILGPEGGLTAYEEQTAAAHGFRPVSLGPKVLRVETAAAAATALAAALVFKA